MSEPKQPQAERPTQTIKNCLDKNLTNVVESNIARNVGAYGDVTLQPLKFGGHCFYVKRAMTGKMVDWDQPWRRELNGIELPEGYADRSRWATVLAKGPAVGKMCSKAHAKRYVIRGADGLARPRPRRLDDQVEIGDMILCPSIGWEYDDIGVERSIYDRTEFYIEESKPCAILKRSLETTDE